MKYKFIIAIFAAAFVFMSCDEFLNTDSPSSFTEDYIFSKEDEAFKAVGSIYARFNQDGYTSRLSTNQAGNTDLECGAVSAAPDGARRDIWSFEATDGNTEVRTAWDNAWLALNRANECIEGISKSPLYLDQANNAMMKQLLGESLALRAFWYHQLVVYWGDVPYKMTPTKAGDEFYLPRTHRDTILSSIINDLIDIEPHMMYARQLPEGIERVNREFVQGLIARIALCRGGYYLDRDGTMKRSPEYLKYYGIARDYAKKMIESQTHVLSSDFRQIFLNQVRYVVADGGDILFEIAFQAGAGDVAWNNGIRVDAGTHPYGSGSNYMSFPPTYYLSFDPTDKRLPVTCAFYYFDSELTHQPSAYSSIAPGKWCRAWMSTPSGANSAKGTGINWPIMRYSDVLLMYAEAENELNGPNADAQNALAMVRRRAFEPNNHNEKVDQYLQLVSSSKDNFFNAIVDERAWEFGGEMLRKFDLIRWNLYGKKIASTRKALTQIGYDVATGSGEYADYPGYIYYTRANDQYKTISFYHIFRKPDHPLELVDEFNPSETDGKYYRLNWLRNLYSETTGRRADYLDRQWRGYIDDTGEAPVPYILPIHNSAIQSSLGVLDNDGWLIKK